MMEKENLDEKDLEVIQEEKVEEIEKTNIEVGEKEEVILIVKVANIIQIDMIGEKIDIEMIEIGEIVKEIIEIEIVGRMKEIIEIEIVGRAKEIGKITKKEIDNIINLKTK